MKDEEFLEYMATEYTHIRFTDILIKYDGHLSCPVKASKDSIGQQLYWAADDHFSVTGKGINYTT